jgi:ATP-dependent RNA helicase RhlE
MRDFRARRFDVLVATDIAARGIDVSDVSHVINYDVPSTPHAYTHRIGRTGRSEQEGKACTFVTGDDWGWVRDTERMIGEAIPRREVERFTEAEKTARPSGSRTSPGRSPQARRPGPRDPRGGTRSRKPRGGRQYGARRGRS